MIPLCACHGVPMYRVANGQRWGCRVKKRERDRKYLLTDQGRSRARRFRLAQTTRARAATITRLKELMGR